MKMIKYRMVTGYVILHYVLKMWDCGYVEPAFYTSKVVDRKNEVSTGWNEGI